MTPNLILVGPDIDAQADCEAVLRSLPDWFGIEESLLMYAHDSARMPTFALAQGTRIVAFLTLKEHFAKAWEVHCVAVHADYRNKGLGRQLFDHIERWLIAQGVTMLQVKTIAPALPNASYALTRGFFARMGYQPLEVFTSLWGPHHPCLQLLKWLGPADDDAADLRGSARRGSR